MTAAVFVMLAAAGVVLRWQVTEQWGRLGTCTLNVTGSFVLGVFAGSGDAVLTTVGTGALGAMTTVSGVAGQLSELWHRRRLIAVTYASATVVAGVAAAWAGLQLS